MTCKFCGGYVEWKGPIIALTHTECAGCGCTDCQEEEWDLDTDEPSELGFTRQEIEQADRAHDEQRDREDEQP